MGAAKDRHMGGRESEVKMAETKNYKLQKPEENEIADIAELNGNMDIIDAQLKRIADAVSATGNASVIKSENITVPVSAWTSNNDIAGFPFRAGISIEGCSEDYMPDVILSASDALSGNFAPVAKTYEGGVFIYAVEKPAASITILTILLTKEVSA